VKRVLAALMLVVAVAAGGVLWFLYSPRRTPEGQPPLRTLGPNGVAHFRSAFNEAGDTRILVLFSPT
jgi:hypothetical protein